MSQGQFYSDTDRVVNEKYMISLNKKE